MKKLLLFILIISSVVIIPTTVSAKAPVITSADLVGRLVLQSESENKLWYINPASNKRWYLHNDEDLDLLIKTWGVKPTINEFSQLATHARYTTPKSLLTKYAGQIIISPNDSDKVYFLNKADGIMYGVGDFDYLYSIAKVIGIASPDNVLRLLAMNTTQATYDPAFYGIAYVKYDGEKVVSSNKNSYLTLPLASLTKVMTALVLLDYEFDWDKIVTITQEEINYPCTLQPCGLTSEIDLKVGDKIKMQDLWVAMLSASSNQSAVILADNSGVTRAEFIAEMNAKAKLFGLDKTKFLEMTGLSADNVSTAVEFAKIAKAAFADLRIADATGSTNYKFNVTQADGTTRLITVNNRNYSLLAMGPRASKSGYLVEAQRNAVIKKNGQIIIAMHCYSLSQRNSIISNLIGDSSLALAY